jgi:hypothetical protein
MRSGAQFGDLVEIKLGSEIVAFGTAYELSRRRIVRRAIAAKSPSVAFGIFPDWRGKE